MNLELVAYLEIIFWSFCRLSARTSVSVRIESSVEARANKGAFDSR